MGVAKETEAIGEKVGKIDLAPATELPTALSRFMSRARDFNYLWLILSTAAVVILIGMLVVGPLLRSEILESQLEVVPKTEDEVIQPTATAAGDESRSAAVSPAPSETGDSRTPLATGKSQTELEIAQGEVLFEDDFEDRDLAGWILQGAGWSLVRDDDGNIVLQGTGAQDPDTWYRIMAGDQSWSNYSMELRARLIDFGSPPYDAYFHVLFRDTGHGCTNYSWGLSEGFSVFSKGVDCSFRTLRTVSGFGMVEGAWTTVRVEVVNNQIKGFVDGRLVADIRDVSAFHESGAFGIGMPPTNTVWFDDVRVVELVLPSDGTSGDQSQQHAEELAQPSLPDMRFTVRADMDWQDTGIEVPPSGMVDVRYLSGTWTTFEGYHPRVTASGNEELGDPKNSNHPLPSAYPGVLIGKVGDGPIEEIGARLRFQSGNGGNLILRMNDDSMADNAGSLLVSISVLSDPALFDDFNSPVHDGAFDETRWGYSSELELTDLNAHQENGALKFDRTSYSSEVDRVLFARAPRSIPLGDLGYFEAKLRLGSDVTGILAFVKIQLTTDLISEGWWTQCRLNGYGSRSPDFVCDAFTHENGDFVNEFLSEATPINYDTWYTVRIQIDRNSGQIDYLLDGEKVGTYVPQTPETLMASKTTAQIGVWQQANSSVIGYVDDVLLGEAGGTD